LEFVFPFFWLRASGNILCICPCNLTASRFPVLVLQSTTYFQVHECVANS
jgi:hypothetical protein